ncbi:MAG: hypothetical protein M1825_002094 [Sarcosagium campestre]|nr:MAG: hypothetical protein M1825_002094 [Sarcosagium campestre]
MQVVTHRVLGADSAEEALSEPVRLGEDEPIGFEETLLSSNDNLSHSIPRPPLEHLRRSLPVDTAREDTESSVQTRLEQRQRELREERARERLVQDLRERVEQQLREQHERPEQRERERERHEQTQREEQTRRRSSISDKEAIEPVRLRHDEPIGFEMTPPETVESLSSDDIRTLTDGIPNGASIKAPEIGSNCGSDQTQGLARESLRQYPSLSRKNSSTGQEVRIQIDDQGDTASKSSQSTEKFILLCLRDGTSAETLGHARVTTAGSDMCMYKALNRKYMTRRRRLLRFLTLRELHEVDFVRFQLYYQKKVAIDDRIDTGQIPPVSKRQDYEFDRPQGHRKRQPLILKTALKHFIEEPTHATAGVKHLSRMPKKMRHKLRLLPSAETELEGWGLRLRERVCWKKVAAVEATWALMALIFAIVWCRCHPQSDLQDGFAVTGVLLAYGTIFLGLMHAAANSL